MNLLYFYFSDFTIDLTEDPANEVSGSPPDTSSACKAETSEMGARALFSEEGSQEQEDEGLLLL